MQHVSHKLSAFLRTGAWIVSVLAHPLLVPTYGLLLLLGTNPYIFGVHSVEGEVRLLILVFFSTFLIPAFAVFMMRMLGLVSSIDLRDRHDRIGPYILTGMFYLWLVINFLNNTDIPRIYTAFMLGASISLFVAFFLNAFTKVSAHAVGMGGLLALMLLAMATFELDYFTLQFDGFEPLYLHVNVLLMILILLAGLVGTARLYLEAHTPAELWPGYLIGLFGQLIAYNIVM